MEIKVGLRIRNLFDFILYFYNYNFFCFHFRNLNYFNHYRLFIRSLIYVIFLFERNYFATIFINCFFLVDFHSNSLQKWHYSKN